MNQTLNDRYRAQEYCQNLVKTHDLAAYINSHFLPKELQTYYFTIHALRIELFKAGEVARHSTLKASRMAWWLDNIEKARLGTPNPEPISIALEFMLRRVSVRKSHLERMVRGRVSFTQLEETSVKTWQHFDRFVDDNYTMSFYLMLEVMGLYGENEFKAATFIGRAVGIADIISRTRLYLETSRCYFPEDLLHKVGSRQHSVPLGGMKEQESDHKQVVPESFYDVVLETAAYGKKCIQEGREVKEVPDKTFLALLPAVWTDAGANRAILRSLGACELLHPPCAHTQTELLESPLPHRKSLQIPPLLVSLTLLSSVYNYVQYQHRPSVLYLRSNVHPLTWVSSMSSTNRP